MMQHQRLALLVAPLLVLACTDADRDARAQTAQSAKPDDEVDGPPAPLENAQRSEAARRPRRDAGRDVVDASTAPTDSGLDASPPGDAGAPALPAFPGAEGFGAAATGGAADVSSMSPT